MDSGERPLLITDAKRRSEDGRTSPGQVPEVHRIMPDTDRTRFQVAHATPDLTRSVRDGVFLQMRC
jgi:hypothetical protein